MSCRIRAWWVCWKRVEEGWAVELGSTSFHRNRYERTVHSYGTVLGRLEYEPISMFSIHRNDLVPQPHGGDPLARETPLELN